MCPDRCRPAPCARLGAGSGSTGGRTGKIAVLAACIAFTAPALAAPPPPASTAPAASTASKVLTVKADSSSAVSTQDHKTEVAYAGHVVIQRGPLTLTGAHALIRMKNQKISTVTVTGKPVHFTLAQKHTPPIKGDAHSIVYHARANTLELDGDVHFYRPGERFSADHVLYWIASRRLKAEGTNHGRVHATLTPASGSSR